MPTNGTGKFNSSPWIQLIEFIGTFEGKGVILVASSVTPLHYQYYQNVEKSVRIRWAGGFSQWLCGIDLSSFSRIFVIWTIHFFFLSSECIHRNMNDIYHCNNRHPLRPVRTSSSRLYRQSKVNIGLKMIFQSFVLLANSNLTCFFCYAGEEMEFVEVNQDEIPGDTWDSFESSEYYDNLDGTHEQYESAATSTTKTMKFTSNNGMILSSRHRKSFHL